MNLTSHAERSVSFYCRNPNVVQKKCIQPRKYQKMKMASPVNYGAKILEAYFIRHYLTVTVFNLEKASSAIQSGK